MIDQNNVPGRLLTPPENMRGWLKVTPWVKQGKIVGLRVRVFTDLGRVIVDQRTTGAEVTKVRAPDPITNKLKTYPGSFWFYGKDTKIGFLADQNAGALALPHAQETGPEGPQNSQGLNR